MAVGAAFALEELCSSIRIADRCNRQVGPAHVSRGNRRLHFGRGCPARRRARHLVTDEPADQASAPGNGDHDEDEDRLEDGGRGLPPHSAIRPKRPCHQWYQTAPAEAFTESMPTTFPSRSLCRV